MNETLKKFEKIEKELNLDRSLIQGVPWWDMVRYPLYEQLLSSLKLKEESNFSNKKAFVRSLYFFFKLIKNFLQIFTRKSPIWIKKNKYIIWGHPRRKFENGLYTDIYSDPFIDLFSDQNEFAVIEKEFDNFHLSPAKTKNLFYGGFLVNFSYLFGLLKNITLNDNESKKVNELEKRLNKSFSCDLNISKILNKKLRIWKGTFPLMKFFLKIKKPKLLFIVNSFGQEPLIAAAKLLKIPTIELQHGSPARGKLNYDYSSGVKKNTFPDKFLSFGDYWSSEISFPIKKKNIISFGFPYLHQKRISFFKIKKENRLVIISQNECSNRLVKLAKNAKKRFHNDVIIEFKPHPNEFYHGKPKYFSDLKDSGVEISNMNKDLYEIFAKSRWQIGVYSTALYEGLYFDTACFVLKATKSDYMKPLIDLGLARYIENVEDIDLNWKVKKSNLDFLFSKPSLNKINSILSLPK